jgi:predicted ester cyclase
MWGQPTGKQVRIMGTTQHHIRDGKIVEEWTLFNELALLWKLRYAA